MTTESNDDDPVAMYLRELANIQPLTRDEEAALFEEIRRASKPNGPSRGLSHEPIIIIPPPGGSVEECLPLGKIAARRLTEAYLRAVVDIAEKFSSSGVPMLELIQEGNIGLMKAIDHFAEQPTGEFCTFAASRIEDAIRTCVSRWK